MHHTSLLASIPMAMGFSDALSWGQWQVHIRGCIPELRDIAPRSLTRCPTYSPAVPRQNLDCGHELGVHMHAVHLKVLWQSVRGTLALCISGNI